MAETTKNGMANVNVSDSDKDTDTESLPEVVHSKFVNKANDQNAWKLHQNVPPAEDESSTGESDLDGVEDEPESGKSKNVGNKSTKIFEIGFSSSTVQIRSKGQAIRFKTDVSDSYNVEEEVFTVAFSKNNPEVIKINPIPKLIAKKKEVDQPTTAVENNSDSEGDDQVTDNDLVQVSFEEYEEIINREKAKNDLYQELKSYECSITQREENEHINEEVGNDTSEDEDDMSIAEGCKVKETSETQKVDGLIGGDDGDDDDDPMTENSCLEVPMMEYYKIRHQTEPGTNSKANGNLNSDSSSKFDTQLFFHSIAKSSTRITSSGQDDEPVTDEDCSSESENDDKKQDEESEEEVTRHSEVQVSMKDYYRIRKENTPVESTDEYVLMQNPVQSMVRMHSEDKNEPEERKSGKDWPEDQDELLASFNRKDEESDDGNCTDDEQMSCEFNVPTKVEEECQIENSGGEKSRIDLKDNFLSPPVRIEISKVVSEEVSFSEITSRPRNIPIIRLVEMDGFQGAIGVACLDPLSPTTDSVFGVKFIESEDITEEISTLSDLEDQLSLAECGRHSPATEDEAVSEFEADSVPSKQEYNLPQARCKIFYTKVSEDGRSTTVEKNVKPFENLSLRQFIQETENVSECDVIQVTDDELEDLPNDNVQTIAKIKAKIPSRLTANRKSPSNPKKSGLTGLGSGLAGSPSQLEKPVEKSTKKKRNHHYRGPRKPKNEPESHN